MVAGEGQKEGVDLPVTCALNSEGRTAGRNDFLIMRFFKIITSFVALFVYICLRI